MERGTNSNLWHYSWDPNIKMDEGLALIIFALDIFMLNNKCSFPKRHLSLSVKIILKYDAIQHCDNYFRQIEGYG